MAVYHQSSVRINAKGEIVKSGGDRPIFVFYGERYRKLTGDQYQGRAYLAALAKKPIALHQTHPWQLAKFVLDFQLIEDPATKKK